MGTLPLTLILVPLFAFGLYRRVTRTFGPQRVARRKMMARMVFLSAIGVFLVALLPTPAGILAALLGAIAGGLLAALGLNHTTFEVTESDTFYTPNRWIGLGVTAIFLGRLGARMIAIYHLTEEALDSGEPPLAAVHRSPFTLGLFFLLAAYYVGYYGGVLRKARTLVPGPRSES